MRHYFDAVIVGAGGAGLTAALQVASSPGLRLAVITKVHPVRSHTGAAQGGVSAALGNAGDDSWLWHVFDTIKGGDYLGDQDAVEVLCREAPGAVYELEHLGLPFSRTADGLIAQRRFGGHTVHFGKEPARRACHAGDRTGQLVLHTLFQQCLRRKVTFFSEFFVTELLVREGRALGVVACELATGGLHVFTARAVLLATGGMGRVFSVTSNGFEVTGDGQALALAAGLPLEDMEFYQFHPTGLRQLGILITEGARGEGGVLRNGSGDRFMEKYAPGLKDLAPRDLVARAIFQETKAGRGVGGKDYVHLDLTGLDPELLERELPGVVDTVRTYLSLEPAQDLIPVQPTAHYAMGGIPTDTDGRVRLNAAGDVCEGLFAAGECACVSIHGANRLGTNSLLELLVMGRRAGREMRRSLQAATESCDTGGDPPGTATRTLRHLRRVTECRAGGESSGELRRQLQELMTAKCSVFRTRADLTGCLERVRELRERTGKVRVTDRMGVFNQELWHAVELQNLVENAECIVASALAREESRGAHWRADFPKRDDTRWLRHTFARRNRADKLVLEYRPVAVTRLQPAERRY